MKDFGPKTARDFTDIMLDFGRICGPIMTFFKNIFTKIFKAIEAIKSKYMSAIRYPEPIYR